MEEKRIKVSKGDWEFLQKAKLKEAPEFEKQLEFEKASHRQALSDEIVSLGRAVAFKKNELSTKEIVEVHHEYKDGLKPEFLLLNEIDALNSTVASLKVQLKSLEENDKA